MRLCFSLMDHVSYDRCSSAVLNYPHFGLAGVPFPTATFCRNRQPGGGGVARGGLYKAGAQGVDYPARFTIHKS